MGRQKINLGLLAVFLGLLFYCENYKRKDAEWDDADDIAHQYLWLGSSKFTEIQGFSESQYQTVIDYAKEALVIAINYFGTDSEQVYSSRTTIASIAREYGDYTLAETQLGKCNDMYIRKFGPKNPERARLLTRLAEICLKQEKYKDAEMLYSEAFKLEDYAVKHSDPSQSASSKDLAEFYDKQGNYEKAEPLFLKELSTKEQVDGMKSNAAEKYLHEVIQFYLKYKKYEEAEPHARKLLDLSRLDWSQKEKPRKPGEKRVIEIDFSGKEKERKICQSLIYLAQILMQTEQYEEAEPAYREIWEIIGDDEPVDIALYLRLVLDLSRIYNEGNRYGDLKTFLDGHLFFYQNLPDYNPGILAMMKEYQATACRELGDLETSLQLQEEVIEGYKNYRPENDPLMIRARENLARIHIAMNHPVPAQKLLLQVLSAKRQTLGEKSLWLISTYSLMGQAYLQTGDNKSAVMYFEQVITIQDQDYDENDAVFFVSAETLNPIPADKDEDDRIQFAQNLHGLATALINLKQFDAALDAINRSLEVSQKLEKINSSLLGRNHLLRARLHQAMGDTVQARKEVEAILGELDCSIPDRLTALKLLGKSLADEKKYGSAGQAFMHYLELMQENQIQESQESFAVLIDLALVNLEQNKIQDAEIFYLHSLETGKRVFPENPVALTPALACGAVIYAAGKDRERTLNCVKDGLARLTANPDYNSGNISLIADAMGRMARACISFSDTRTALDCFYHELEIRRTMTVVPRAELLTLYENIARLHLHIKEYQLAEATYELLLKICVELYGDESEQVATVYDMLAICNHNQNNNRNAADYSKKALGIRLKSPETQAVKTAANLQNLALFEQNLGDQEQAESYYRESIKYWEAINSPKNPNYAICLYNLANFYNSIGKYSEAETMCQRALDLRVGLYGEYHQIILQTLELLKKIYYNQNFFLPVTGLLKRIVTTSQKVWGENHLVTANAHEALGIYFFNKEKKFEEAAEQFQKALEIRQNRIDADLVVVAKSMHQVALANQALYRYREAEKMFLLAIETMDRVPVADKKEYLPTLNGLFNIYQLTRQREKAEEIAKQIKQIEIQ